MEGLSVVEADRDADTSQRSNRDGHCEAFKRPRIREEPLNPYIVCLRYAGRIII